MLRFLTIAGSIALLSFACGCEPGPGEEAEICNGTWQQLPDRTDRMLEIGTGGPGDFVALADGASIDVVVGGQGSEMVTPSLRIAAAGEEAESLCLMTELKSGEEGGEKSYLTFERDGDAYVSGAIYHPLYGGDTGDDGMLHLEASVFGTGFEGHQTVAVTLYGPS